MNRLMKFRAGWVKYGLLLALVLAGGAAGWYLSGAPTDEACEPGACHATVKTVSPAPSLAHRFPLSKRDVKDGNEAPELDRDSADRVFLTWASKTGEAERTVFVTRTTDAGRTFDAPRTLSKGGVYRSRGGEGYERRATPHVAATETGLHLTWSEATTDGANMRLLLATSHDSGVTFDLPRPVHKAKEANPTFTAMGIGPGGALACAWLGGPAGQQPFAAVRRAGTGLFDEELLVHPGQNGKGVCPCCPTALCFAPDSTLFVAYRNIVDGYRDIAVSQLRPGQKSFEQPVQVVPPTWKFSGCPHDGPSLAVLGDTLHVVWMDARTGSSRCYHAWAKLADMKFTAVELHPIAVGTQGNARLHADRAGRLHAVWEESDLAPPAGRAGKHEHAAVLPTPGAAGRAIQYAALGSDGRFTSPRALAPRTGAFQTRPAITVAADGRVFVAWNELDDKGKAVVVLSFKGDEPGSRP